MIPMLIMMTTVKILMMRQINDYDDHPYVDNDDYGEDTQIIILIIMNMIMIIYPDSDNVEDKNDDVDDDCDFDNDDTDNNEDDER